MLDVGLIRICFFGHLFRHKRSSSFRSVMTSTDILGEPDFGPEIGIDDPYYLYCLEGEINLLNTRSLISFVAVSMKPPPAHVFIKCAAF